MLPNSEWILLALLAVVLLKPEDVPTLARFLARFIRQAQQLWNDLVVTEIDKHTHVLKNFKEHSKKHPFRLSPPRAKSQPVKD